MVEYYKLYLLTKKDYCKPWEEMYLSVNNDKSERIVSPPSDTIPVFSRIKEVSEEEALGVLEKIEVEN